MELNNGVYSSKKTAGNPDMHWEEKIADNRNLFIAVGIILLVFVRLIYLYVLGHAALPPATDQAIYEGIAREMRHGNLLDMRLLFVSPLYPYIVALLSSEKVLLGLQMLCAIGSTILVFKLTKRLYQEDSIAFLAALLFSLSGPLLLLESKVYPTSLSIFTMLAGLCLYCGVDRQTWSLESKLRSFFSGVAITLTVLLNQSLILLPVLLLLLLPPKRFVALRLFILPLILALAFVSARNFKIDRTFLPLGANSGVTVAHGNLLTDGNKKATGSYRALPGSDGTKNEQHLEARILAERKLKKLLSWKEVDRFWKLETLKSLRQQQEGIAPLFTSKLKLFFTADFIGMDTNLRVSRAKTAFFYLFPVGFVFLWTLAFFALLLYRSWHPAVVAVFLSVLFVNIVFFVSERYRLPAVAILSIPAAAALKHMLFGIRGKLRIFACLILAAMLLVNLTSRPTSAEGRLSDYNRAHGLERQGKTAEARDIYRAIYEKKRNPRTAHALIRSLLTLGQLEEAEKTADSALLHYPDQANLLNNKGVILLRQKRYASAKVYFDKALAANPPIAAVKFNLASVAEKLGDMAKAANWYRAYTRDHPERFKGWYSLARSLYSLGSYEEQALNAIAVAKRAAHDDNKKLGEAKNLEGLLLERLKRWDASREAYEHAHKLMPDSPLPLLNLALHYQQQGDKQKHEKYMRLAKEKGLQPKNKK